MILACLVILCLGGNRNLLAEACQGNEVFREYKASLKYLSELGKYREAWIELNKREIDSYQHYYADLRKIRKLIKQSQIQYSRLNQCLFEEPSSLTVSRFTREASQGHLEALKSFQTVIEKLESEVKFLRVYDSDWAQKLSRKLEGIRQGVSSITQPFEQNYDERYLSQQPII